MTPKQGQPTRPMRMSPDLDFKVDKRDRHEELPDNLKKERADAKVAREELKKVIMKQRITLEKNTRLYREMKQRLSLQRQPIQSI